jgi:pimeloyl-ACP methyl ester carboxylesterase
MVTEAYLNGTYYKYYQEEKNEHLLFLLPGQSLTPRAFWEFQLPEGKTHTDYFVQGGLDVILFDPVGYGNSKEFYNYTRKEFADQINDVTNELTKKYKNKVIFGFSTTTAPALLSIERGYFNKIIIQGPSIRNNASMIIKHDEVFQSNIDKLFIERIQNHSDKLIGKSTKLPGIKQSIVDVVGTHWKAPAKIVYDINNYWSNNYGQPGFKPSDREILSIIGEYDYESLGPENGYNSFKRSFPNYLEIIIPNTTHFSMWEMNCTLTRDSIINYSKKV